MPAPADPRRAMPRREAAGPARWRREFRDHEQRPMTGSVTFYPRPMAGERVVSLAPITVDIVDGVAEVVLPEGTYNVAERTVSPGGVETPFAGSYTLSIP